MNAKRRKKDDFDKAGETEKMKKNESGDHKDVGEYDFEVGAGADPAGLGVDPAGAYEADGEGGSDERVGDVGDPMDPYAEIERLRSQYLRLNADFDNFRKRTQRDKQDWSRYASQYMMEKLLRVIDNFEAAAGTVANANQDATNVTEGFLMIYKQMIDILKQEGLEEIPALGAPFDPNVHEAVMTVSPGENQKENEVVMVMRKGYMFKDKVLRPAMVQVAKDM